MEECDDPCDIQCEFLHHLKIANIYIGLHDICKDRSINKIAFETHKISVITVNKDKASSCKTLLLPSNILLAPRSMSRLKPTSNGWLLRVAFQRDDDVKVRSSNNFVPACSYCANIIINSSPEFSDGLVEISATNNQLHSSTYFCHEHDHDDNNEKHHITIPLEVIVDEQYRLLHPLAIDNKKIIITANHMIECARCHHELGMKKEGSVALHMYKYCVVANSSAFSLGTFLKQLTTSNRLLLQATDNKDTLRLWIIDRNLVVLKARQNSEKPNLTNVCKILYQIEMNQRPKDIDGERVIQVDSTVLLELSSKLVESTSSLPLSWRFVNEFSVGYLDC